jgi:hypothetical protein
MTIKEEIPTTEQGLITFIAYCERETKECDLKKRRLAARIEACHARLAVIKGGDHGKESVE